MTTRDPRSRSPGRPDPGRESAREPTQSLSLDIGDQIEPPESDVDSRISHPSLAMGTSGDSAREDNTKIASPAGRHKTPVPRATKPPTSRAAGESDYAIGTVLGTYKLVEILGRGGMGYVFRAEHTKLGREVALKLLRADYAKRRDAVLRFFQEAKTVNRVRHRNIVDVTDFVELDDGTTFIIMELLRGQSLGKWARTGVDLPRALAVLVQICDGLGAAHAVGVVHRDLKPDNVIVVPTSDGAELVKLLDFGVAKLVNREDQDDDIGFQTAAGSVIGTPAYMSPEQAGGMAVDSRSDIYSLGAIMYELFCGQPMFRGRSFGEYVRKHLTEMPVPPRQTTNGGAIDPNLEALILKSLAKDPNERFSHILELRDGLLHLLGGVETQPPSFSQLSANRTGPPAPMAPTAAMPIPVPSLPPHMLPLPPQAMTTQSTPPSIHTYNSGQQLMPSGLHQSVFSQYSVAPEPMPVPVPEPSTPWFMWALGGVVAVGLGIGGALWYANSSSESDHAAKPTTAPIDNAGSAKPAAPQLVELKFDSLPSAGVYADGRSAELCKTPCNFNVDLADGGPVDRRTFVVRTEGYKDRQVVVDFNVAQRDFSVTLEHNDATVPTITETTETKPTSEELTPDETDTTTSSKTDKKTHKKKGSKKGSDKQVEAKQDDTKLEVLPDDPKPPDPVPEKTDKKSDGQKPGGTIDPSDTIDPFSRKK